MPKKKTDRLIKSGIVSLRNSFYNQRPQIPDSGDQGAWKMPVIMHLKYYLFISIFIVLQPAFAQQFQLLKDVNNSTDSKPSNIYNAPDGRTISAFAILNNVAYFSATDSGKNKLWRSDGTTNGTYIFQNSAASSITRCGNKIFYICDSSGYQVLSVSDGTTSGTTILKKFEDYEVPANLVDIEDTLYFTLFSYLGQSELWKSGGTKQTTNLIKTFGGYESQIIGMANVDGEAFFINTIFNTSDSLAGVWKSDGTAAGTKRIFSGSGFALGVNPYSNNGKYYFAVSKFRQYLYVADGTSSSATELAEVYFAHNFTSLNGITYFSGRDDLHGAELWRTDGTKPGTYMLKDIVPGRDSSSPQALTVIGNNIYFNVKDANGNRNLWKLDAATQAVSLIKDFGEGRLIAPSAFTNYHDTLFFTAYSETQGVELWKSDGTSGGTIQFKDIFAGQPNSNPNYLTPLSSKLLFAAYDAQHGNEIWSSDGTETNTNILKDINTINTSSSNNWLNLSKLKNRIFFAGFSPANNVTKDYSALWSSDGTGIGTKNVTGVGTNAKISVIPDEHFATENRIYFTGLDKHYSMQLWYTDTSETKFVTNVLKESGANFISDDYVLNGADLPGPFCSSDSNTYYFTLYNLWKIDERTNAVTLLSKLDRGSFTKVNNELIVASDSNLFKIDRNTNLLEKISNATLSTIDERNLQTAATDKNMFFLSDGNLWKTDGTNNGTIFLNEVKPYFVQFENKFSTSINETLYFAGDDGVTGQELWKTDGTVAGTQLVDDINPGTGKGVFGFFCRVNNRIFFSADDGAHGTELWTSDGTAAGTVLVKDINVGSANSSISSLTKFGDKLVFLVFNNPLNSYTLWQSDGTEAGTFAVDDPIFKIVSITRVSGTPGLYVFNSELYFIGLTTEYGSEIWKGKLECQNNWTGVQGNVWENTGNWSCGTLPDENTDVVINSGTVQLNSNATIRSLTLKPGVVFTISEGYHLTILH